MSMKKNTLAFIHPDGTKKAFNLSTILKWLADSATEDQITEVAKIANARVTIFKTLENNEDWV